MLRHIIAHALTGPFAVVVIALLAADGAAAAADSAAATPPPAPRIVIQLGHSSPVDAAAWLPARPSTGPNTAAWADGTRLISADAADNAVIIWGVDGRIFDKLSIPMLDAAGLYENQSVRSLTVSADSHTAHLVVEGLTRNPDASSSAALFAFDLDLDSRRFTAVGKPRPLPMAQLTEISQEANRPLPATADGRLRLSRQDNGIVVTRSDGSAAPVTLEGAHRDIKWAVDLTDDGSALVGVKAGRVGTGPWRSYTNVVYAADGATLPATWMPGTGYDRLAWIDKRHYAVFASGAYPHNGGTAPTQVVDIFGGAANDEAFGGQPTVIGTIPAKCMTTPAGDGLRFVGAGPASCGAPASAADGLWVFERDDPAGNGDTLARHWQQRAIPELNGEVITALSVADDPETGAPTVIAATRSAVAVKGSYTLKIFMIPLDGSRPVRGSLLATDYTPQGWPGQQPGVQRIVQSIDGRKLIVHADMLVIVIDLARRKRLPIDVRNPYPEIMASDGHQVIFAARDFQYIQRFDAETGARLPSVHVPGGVLNGGLLSDRPVFWAVARDGALRLWDMRSGALLLTQYAIDGSSFFVFRPDGRYDTNVGAETDAVLWLMPGDPWHPQSVAALMRNFNEPSLYSRQLGCLATGCDSEFPALPDVSNLNRATPVTNIVAVTPGPGPYQATVDVETRETFWMRAPGDLVPSGAYDLRLLMDGRLVRQFPDQTLPAAARGSPALWRQLTEVPDAGTNQWVTHRFVVPLPTGNEPISFAAYAFNEDRIKGFTYPFTWTPPVPVPARPRRAVILAIGVDKTHNPDWRLHFAASDAEAITRALAGIPDRHVVPILLTSTDTADNATGANIRAVMRQLIGAATPADQAALAALELQSLAPLTPDDIVILSYSGHGETVAGDFYMVPSDAQPGPDGLPVLASLLSSSELTAWARNADAGEMAMIIDACHSGAAVEQPGFKPGPMGDPGLGQVAYDKGIRILAATQAGSLAHEDPRLGHGLLTWALVAEGLDRQRATGVYGNIDLRSWLRYGVNRLPSLTAELARGEVAGPATGTGSRDLQAFGAPAPVAATRPPQRPSLFDFADLFGDHEVVLRSRPAQRDPATPP